MRNRAIIYSILIASCILLTPVSKAATLDQNFVTTDDPNNGTALGITTTALAQSFTVGLSGILDSISFNIYKDFGTTGDLTVEIRDMSGGEPDLLSASALASSTVPNADIDTLSFPDPYGNVVVDFSSANISVSSGDILAFVLLSPIDEDFGVQTDYLDGYAGGSRFSQNGDGNAWGNLANADLAFSTYVEVSAVPVPAAIWLFGTGILGLIGFSKRRKVA